MCTRNFSRTTASLPGQFAVGIAVCIQSSLFVQLDCVADCTIQQNGIGNVNAGVQIDIAVQNAAA